MPRRARQTRVAIVASRFNEAVTNRLLSGARECLAERGVPERLVEVHWVSGAWELPVMAGGLLQRGGYRALAALGAVIRGETLHFEVIAGEAARGLMELQLRHGVPVGFGVLTCDTLEQALQRSGGGTGNKGYEAMAAALDVADRIGGRSADSR
jgi:6,7-dimethyl-8-ribityllumazine synthase